MRFIVSLVIALMTLQAADASERELVVGGWLYLGDDGRRCLPPGRWREATRGSGGRGCIADERAGSRNKKPRTMPGL
jgi:hypothetical protein